MDPGDRTRVVRLNSKHFYPLGHLICSALSYGILLKIIFKEANKKNRAKRLKTDENPALLETEFPILIFSFIHI